MGYFHEINKFKYWDIFSLSDPKSLWLEKRGLNVKVKVKHCRYRSGVAQRVPGS